ncbi:MAG: hypothetical protein JST20_06130 [Bacteroidetes bacterium]|nr:hypothetical protein [Bacteroidota bacterium]
MKKNIIFLCAFIVVGLSTQPVFSQYYWPNCGSINCTTSTQWQYITDFTITDFMVTETIGGVPPYTYSIPCTTTVHVDFRWRICDGKYEFELWKFWWEFLNVR